MNAIETLQQSAEIDCPWFDDLWLADHPEFPLASLASGTNNKERAQ